MKTSKALNNSSKLQSDKQDSQQLEDWQRKLPPVSQLCLVSLGLVIIDGIYIAAHLPNFPSMTVVVILLSLGGALAIISCLLLSQIKAFAWDKFFLVLRWIGLEYLIEAGMLGYIFIFDDVRGKTLLILILILVIFAIDIPIIMAFTVARYQNPSKNLQRSS
jgi:hypothetical protein